MARAATYQLSENVKIFGPRLETKLGQLFLTIRARDASQQRKAFPDQHIYRLLSFGGTKWLRALKHRGEALKSGTAKGGWQRKATCTSPPSYNLVSAASPFGLEQGQGGTVSKDSTHWLKTYFERQRQYSSCLNNFLKKHLSPYKIISDALFHVIGWARKMNLCWRLWHKLPCNQKRKFE